MGQPYVIEFAFRELYEVLYIVLNTVHILGHCFVSVKTNAARA